MSLYLETDAILNLVSSIYGGLTSEIKIPLQELELKLGGGLTCEGGRNRGILRYMSRRFYILCLGLPNALGGYDETPEIMSKHLKVRKLLYGWSYLTRAFLVRCVSIHVYDVTCTSPYNVLDQLLVARESCVSHYRAPMLWLRRLCACVLYQWLSFIVSS